MKLCAVLSELFASPAETASEHLRRPSTNRDSLEINLYCLLLRFAEVNSHCLSMDPVFVMFTERDENVDVYNYCSIVVRGRTSTSLFIDL